MKSFVQIKGMSALGLAAVLSLAQGQLAQAQGQGAVMTSGNGVAVSGTWDANGFHGIYSGPSGVGRVVQPPQRKIPINPVANVAAGVVVGQGATVVIGDPDDTGVVSVGTSMGSAGASAGAFAGAGGAIAISGPNGVAVGVPGVPMIVAGNGTYLLNGVQSIPRNRLLPNPPPPRTWTGQIPPGIVNPVPLPPQPKG